MLHRAPAERFASMTDVREALEALADRVQKPPAPPPGSARHLRTFAAGALLVPLTALSVAGGMVIYRTTRSPVPAVPAPSMTALVASERVDAAAFGASTDPDLDAARLPEAAPPPRSILNSSWVDIDVEPLRSWFDEERSRAWKKAVQPALIRCLNSRPVPLSCPPDGGTLSLTISPQGRVVRASMSTRGLRAGLDGPFCTLPEWTPCTTAAARTMDLTPSAKRGADMDVSLGLYFDATRNRAPH